ncbi:MAG: hypothetical protein ACRDSK_20990 [Actinophytocola sp.]|uniref:hypothetical protein n=1 Tax=Actinophytocola sp. TaxID=1872138 RepID=UPI003D6B0C97
MAAIRHTTTTRPDRLLRESLAIDGVASGLSGVALLALAGVLADPLGIPTGVLLGFGAFALVYGAAVLLLGTRSAIDRRGAGAVVAANLVMGLGSGLVVLAGIGDPTTLGEVVLVALAVFGFAVAAVQYAGLSRGSRA